MESNKQKKMIYAIYLTITISVIGFTIWYFYKPLSYVFNPGKVFEEE